MLEIKEQDVELSSSDEFQPPNFTEILATLARLYPKPTITAHLRTQPEDFKVFEQLAFEPSGEGEHLFLQIEKIGANTDWVAKQLQKVFDLNSKEVGYAGKKDRHSVSTQWFSLHLPGKQVELSLLKNDAFKIIKSVRHNKKLKIGSVKENHFKIILREVSGQLEPNLIDKIVQHGVPNYFGSQRFGFNSGNLYLANDYLSEKCKIKNRNKRGLIISSARSLLFNMILSERVKSRNWNRVIEGDCLMLDNSQSFFCVDSIETEEQTRLDRGELHVSGLLPGREDSQTKLVAKTIEDSIIREFSIWKKSFHRLNISSARRSLRCIPKDLNVEQQGDQISLRFSLNKGCYATSVLREMINVTDVSMQNASTK